MVHVNDCMVKMFEKFSLISIKIDPDENAGDDVCIPPSNNRRKKNLTGGADQTDHFSASVTGQRGR